MPVYLYLIGQRETYGYDTYSSAVVSAHSAEDAAKIHPNRFILLWGEDSDIEEPYQKQWQDDRSWVSDPSQVEVEYIGIADSSIPNNSIILSSFHAG